MPPDRETSAQLATFDPPLAAAVAAVLRREGVPATVEPLDHVEAEVRVPAARRGDALDLLAARMEQIRALVDEEAARSGVPLALAETPDDAGPPIFMERLRRMGLGLTILLAPLLIITLAAPDLPVGYALVLFVGGLVAIVYWRDRSDR